MSDAPDLSSSIESDLNNFFQEASSIDESPVSEGFNDLFEVTDLNPPGGVGGSGSGSGAENPNGDKSGGGDFAITVNGSAATIGPDGLPVYASTVSLSCNDGHVILLAGGSASADNKISHGSFNASFPVGDENAFFGVYGQATYNTTESEERDAPSGNPVATKSIVIDTSANVATAFKDGWSRDASFASNAKLVYMFPIGVVCLQKDGNNRRVFVNQIQSGNKNINFSTLTDSSGSVNIDIGDGFRELIFAINGEPFKGFFDVRGIKRVT
tara:strand:+ start:1309 stop:2118 length:810 start_codon:yes stop_codon:yes gene_type:complete